MTYKYKQIKSLPKKLHHLFSGIQETGIMKGQYKSIIY